MRVKRTRVHTWEIVINGQFCKVILASSLFLDLFEIRITFKLALFEKINGKVTHVEKVLAK
jgi:hypothetical protein